MKKAIIRALVLGSLMVVAVHALGANNPRGVTGDNSALKITTSRQGTRTPYVADSSDSLIYGNLATKDPKGAYWCCGALQVSGPNSLGGETWTAAAFTPTANATVTKVKIAVGYLFSTNTYDLLLSLNADNNGVPGEALETWKVKIPGGKPVFGSCCVVKSQKASIPVSANTQYWVVLSTEADSDMFAGWNFNDSDQLDAIPVAQTFFGVWTVVSDVPVPPAFAVYGH